MGKKLAQAVLFTFLLTALLAILSLPIMYAVHLFRQFFL